MKNLLEQAKQVLTPRELQYFMIMNGKAGTLYVEGPPGGGKSAIFKSIAKKLGMRYLPFDAPAMEETEIGLYPKTVTVEYGPQDRIEAVEYVPPVWAIEAERTSEPVLIVFEEINRNTRLMNAILNVLNERRIGFKVRFGDNVFIAATGNLGTEDGTIVEEMDAAQKGRLIIKRHVIDGNAGRLEWEEGHAAVETPDRKDGQVLPIIRKYLEKNPANISPEAKKNDASVVVNARRWTYLNEAIINNLGYNVHQEELRGFVSQHGSAYVGTYAVDFLKFLEENKRFTVEDVLEGRASKANRDNATELAEQLRAIDVTTLPQNKLKNLIAFLETLDQDALAAYISEMLVATCQKFNEDDPARLEYIKHKNVKAIITKFQKIYDQL